MLLLRILEINDKERRTSLGAVNCLTRLDLFYTSYFVLAIPSSGRQEDNLACLACVLSQALTVRSQTFLGCSGHASQRLLFPGASVLLGTP